MTTTLFLNTIQKVSATLFHPNVNEERQERATKKGGKRGRWAENARTPVKVVPLDRVLHNFPRLIG